MGLPGAFQAYNARDLTILKGAVPVSGRGLMHTAPTYTCRSPGICSGRPRWSHQFW